MGADVQGAVTQAEQARRVVGVEADPVPAPRQVAALDLYAAALRSVLLRAELGLERAEVRLRMLSEILALVRGALGED